jgi:PAS domain S-box-containing protein
MAREVGDMSTCEWNPEQRATMFDEIPSGIMLIDRDRIIVDHNEAFGALFGESRGKPCYRVFRDRDEICAQCPASETFENGTRKVLEQSGRDRNGHPVHYLVQLTPAQTDSSGVHHVAAITTDLTASRRLQREYQILFEKVPCFVAVINRDYRVVKANERFRKTFGEPTGERCYRLFKHRAEPCPDCPVEQTFLDGKPHTVRQLGMDKDGTTTHYVAFTAPLVQDDDSPTHAIHMSLDVTDVHQLESQITQGKVMRRILVENSFDATVVFDSDERIQLANRAAEELWGYPRETLIGRKAPAKMIPAPLKKVIAGRKGRELLHESSVTTRSGERVPVRGAAVTLDLAGEHMGSAVTAHDLTELKKLATEKLEAERLAAVGQTVAGLAHGIKNILTGLEGGMYVTSSGLEKGDHRRVRQGWQMLERNMSRISALAKNLLAFSRGDHPNPSLVRPAEIVEDVVSLYRESTAQHNIGLQVSVEEGIEAAWMDIEGIHSCLVNLISNAMDACLVSQNPECTIHVNLCEREGTIVFEVRDTGCGMDYEVKQKAFTSFFTTKQKGGTGIGLLITRKIVQQHGGSVTLMSTPGEGATFRLNFPRDRLPKPEPKESGDE